MGERTVLKGLDVAVKKAGMTYRDLSSRVGYTYPTLYRKRSGQMGVTLEDLRRLSEILGCTISELVDGFERNPIPPKGT
jgi:transcriptional regulator with XRE-family HTH domain